jgi:PQQ-dependent dehydrogenase (methanol/ethanol family)
MTPNNVQLNHLDAESVPRLGRRKMISAEETRMKRRMLTSYWIRVGLPLLILFSVFALWLSPLRPMPKASGEEEGRENHDWRFYGKDLANTRFQNVDQINRNNVHELKVAWVFHTGVLDPLGELEVSPIVVDGRMYVTDGHDNVFALNAATGKLIWSYKPTEIPGEMPPLDEVTVCCGRNNHGVAFGDGKVFYGRLDDVVVALNAKTGAVVWKKTVADFTQSLAINMAPQIVDGMLIVSLSGGEYEVRGQVIALNAENGNEIWRFHTTKPDSFAGTSWQKGGAAVWNTPSVDPELGLIYLNTGNAAPDIQGQDRAGDNLYATSLVALDMRTGHVVWHFQEVHHDIWDYDSAQTSVLFPLHKDGLQFKAIGHCSKNGNYYILDRRNGKPIFPVTEVPVPVTNVPPGVDTTFQNASPTQPVSSVEPLTPMTFVRPTPATFTNPDGTIEAVTLAPQYTPPGDKLILIVPGDDGGCEWAPAGYSPRTKFVYYGTRYEPNLFKTRKDNRSILPNGLHLGSTFFNGVPGSNPFGLFGATDTRTGKVVWKVEIPFPAKSGVVIAGDLVFFGDGSGTLYGVDAEKGKVLFKFDTPAHVHNAGGAAAGPIAYVVEGREFIANAFGGNVPDRANQGSNAVGDAIVAFTLSLPEKPNE